MMYSDNNRSQPRSVV